ncbi:MAG TPA: sigma-70 family RNA polymerase sigma factor [Myxococcales bacterium]
MDQDRRLSALMTKAQGGDGPAYEMLLAEVLVLVRAFARRRLRQPDALEDVTQETLLSIHRDRHTYDPLRPFLPWMYAIARHRLFDFAEKQRRRSRNEISAASGMEDGAPAQIASQDAPDGFLRRALALLSTAQREVIAMLKVDGLSVAEISRRTGRSQSSVKITAHRGYEKLRRLLKRPAKRTTRNPSGSGTVTALPIQ